MKWRYCLPLWMRRCSLRWCLYLKAFPHWVHLNFLVSMVGSVTEFWNIQKHVKECNNQVKWCKIKLEYYFQQRLWRIWVLLEFGVGLHQADSLVCVLGSNDFKWFYNKVNNSDVLHMVTPTLSWAWACRARCRSICALYGVLYPQSGHTLCPASLSWHNFMCSLREVSHRNERWQNGHTCAAIRMGSGLMGSASEARIGYRWLFFTIIWEILQMKLSYSLQEPHTQVSETAWHGLRHVWRFKHAVCTMLIGGYKLLFVIQCNAK